MFPLPELNHGHPGYGTRPRLTCSEGILAFIARVALAMAKRCSLMRHIRDIFMCRMPHGKGERCPEIWGTCPLAIAMSFRLEGNCPESFQPDSKDGLSSMWVGLLCGSVPLFCSVVLKGINRPPPPPPTSLGIKRDTPKSVLPLPLFSRRSRVKLSSDCPYCAIDARPLTAQSHRKPVEPSAPRICRQQKSNGWAQDDCTG